MTHSMTVCANDIALGNFCVKGFLFPSSCKMPDTINLFVTISMIKLHTLDWPDAVSTSSNAVDTRNIPQSIHLMTKRNPRHYSSLS